MTNNNLANRELLAMERPLISFSIDEIQTVLNRAGHMIEQAEAAKDPILEKILIAMAEKAILDVQNELALRN